MPLLDLFFAMAVFFLWAVWLWLLISVFADIFRSDDLSGWGKAAWTVFAVVAPYLGVLAYLVARGSTMQERERGRAREAEQAMADYVRRVAGSPAPSPSPTDELVRLAELHANGALTDDEFRARKSRLLGA